jgi:hypothetical protein
MRRIVVEAARRKNRVKHGGGRARDDVELADLPTRLPPDDILALDEALGRLERLDPVKARLVTLRYFAGMTVEQAVAIAGGFTPRARQSSVELARRDDAGVARVDVPMTTIIRPGDTVFVHERWF